MYFLQFVFKYLSSYFLFIVSYKWYEYLKKIFTREKAEHQIKGVNIPLYPGQYVPKSVNFHFTRKCNYECGFCFHTAKTSYVLPVTDAQKGLLMLKNCGM